MGLEILDSLVQLLTKSVQQVPDIFQIIHTLSDSFHSPIDHLHLLDIVHFQKKLYVLSRLGRIGRYHIITQTQFFPFGHQGEEEFATIDLFRAKF